MSFQAMAWAVEQPLKGMGKLVLLLLANYTGRDGVCFPSQKELAEQCGITDRAVRVWLKKLEASGFIQREKRQRIDGSRTSDLITINTRKTSPELGSGRSQSNRNETTGQPELRSAYSKEEPITEPITKEKASKNGNGSQPSEPRRTAKMVEGFKSLSASLAKVVPAGKPDRRKQHGEAA